MRFPLDIDPSLHNTLLFWITRYIKFKANTLSSRNVKNQSIIQHNIMALNSSPQSIEALSDIVKEIRKGGIEGVKSFYIPVEKLFHYLLLQKLTSLKEIDDEVIIDFLTSNTAGMSDATKKNYRNAISNFFNYISDHNENEPNSGNGFIFHLNISNWQGLSGKKGNKIPSYLTEDEVTLFLNALDSYSFVSDRSAIFYNLLIRLILHTGLRISEALSIQTNKIQKKEAYFLIKLVGKGNKNSIIEVPKEALEPYLTFWNREASCPNGLLFCSPQNAKKEASASSASHKIKELLHHAGIVKEKEGAHLLRHTYGTLLYSKVKDLALVQEMMRHEDPATTRAYTHIDNQKRREATDILSTIIKKNEV
jgi:integrase/recombinase XerD